MKKSIIVLAAIFAVFAFTGMAMAENRVEVKVTSEPIAYKAICDKAGGFSLEFDSNTTITSGDQITIDLDYTSPSDFAAICKKIALEISMGGSGTEFRAINIDPATSPVLNPSSPLYYVDDLSDASVDDLTDSGAGIYFRVSGNVATQRITVDVLGTGAITVGPSPGDKLVLVFLDQKTNADWTLDGIYVDNDLDGTYDDEATSSDNTLCINVSQWSQATVKGNMDSEADKYTFIPSNPQIAHVAAAANFALAYCTKSTTGRIACGAKGVQAIDTCTSFDFEDPALDGTNGYIANTHLGTNRLIISSTSPFPLTNYQIRLEILVNGLTGDNGVYWMNDTILADGYNDLATACAQDTLAEINALPAVGLQANYTYLNGAGGAATPAVSPKGAGSGSCDVAAANRAVSVTTDESGLGLAATNDYLMINMPDMHYDIDDISQDDVVSVRVTLIKAPCGTIFQGTLQVGTMCAVIVNPPPAVNTVVYPYFTAMAGDLWWDGLVITNLTDVEGEFTAIVYEEDGDVGSFTGIVEPHQAYQTTLELELAGATLVTAGSDGVLGNAKCYVLVCTNFTADGFGFMGSLSTNALMANESMGYLPRVDYINAADNLTFCTSLGVTPGEDL